MLPFLPIVLQLLPDLFKIFSNEKGTEISTQIADAVDKAVKEATKQSAPAAAKQVVDQNPAIAAELQQKLAQIQLDATQAQLNAAIEKQKLENEAAAKRQQLENEETEKRRQAEIAALHERIADVQSARGQLAALAASGSPLQWGAPLVSLAVILFLFIVLLALLNTNEANKWSNDASQIINIMIGALVAAFTAVVNFWIGSSQGSRDKDDVIKEQAKTTEGLKQQVAAKAAPPAWAPGGAAQPTPARKDDNFERCLQVTLVEEGGFSNDPRDSGGATNLGITIGTLRMARNDDTLTEAEVRALTREEAKEIYRTYYWNVARCGDLPPGLDLAVFDMGVNAGPHTSVRLLQKALEVKADGSVGPMTLAAAEAARPRIDEIINKFCEYRLEYYQGLAKFPIFGNGWTKRTKRVQEKALAMAR